MCELDELCGLAKKLKEEQDTAAKESIEHHVHKKQAQDVVRVQNEIVEYQWVSDLHTQDSVLLQSRMSQVLLSMKHLKPWMA